MVLETNIGDILKALDGQRKHEMATTKVEKTVLRDPNAPDPKAKKRWPQVVRRHHREKP